MFLDSHVALEQTLWVRWALPFLCRTSTQSSTVRSSTSQGQGRDVISILITRLWAKIILHHVNRSNPVGWRTLRREGTQDSRDFRLKTTAWTWARISSPHNHISQLLTINFFLYLFIHILLFSFPWRLRHYINHIRVCIIECREEFCFCLPISGPPNKSRFL